MRAAVSMIAGNCSLSFCHMVGGIVDYASTCMVTTSGMQMQCRGWRWFYGCFWMDWRHVGGMSLNRYEQTLYDYVKGHADERQHWQHKVRAILADSAEIPGAVARIDSELWRYYEERS